VGRGGGLAVLGVDGGGAPGGGRTRASRQRRRRLFSPGRKTIGRGGLAGPAKAQWRFIGGGPKGGKGEWAGRGGWRGRPRLGRIRSRARIQKKFQLILEFGGTFKICTRIFRNKFGMRIFPKVF
jgi:hypothetical protein